MSMFGNLTDANISRRSFVAVGSAAAAAFLAGCSTGASGSSSEAATTAGTTYKVCFVEIVENDAFVQMMGGFKDEMKEQGYACDYTVENAQGDSSTLNQIAANLKSADYDVIVPIATPAAQACCNAELETPMVFISVTNAVAAGLLSDNESPDKNMTGTSNVSPVDEIYQFGLELLPTIADKPLGILYCSGETNAVVTVEKMKEYLDGEAVTYTEQSISTSADAEQAAATLASECGAIYVPMDSVVQSAMAAVTAKALESGVPVLGSDPVMPASGALLSVSAGYPALGGGAADLAIKIFEGTAVSDLPVDVVDDYEKVVNEATADALGITIPDDEDITVVEG